MALVDKTQLAQPVAPPSAIPSNFPAPPASMVRAFPEFAAWVAALERLHKAIRQNLQDTSGDVLTSSSQQQANTRNFYRGSDGRLRTDGELVAGGTIYALAFDGGSISAVDVAISDELTVAGEATFTSHVWLGGQLKKPAPDAWSPVLLAGTDTIEFRRDGGTGKIHFRVNGADVGGVVPVP